MKKLVLIIIILTFVSGCSIKRTNELTDAEKFATEYSIKQAEAFKYAKLDEIFQILQDGSGIILFGDSDCEISNLSIDIFSEILEKRDIFNVYYYNPKAIIDSKSDNYEKLMDLLDEAIDQEDSSNNNLELPSIFFVKDGKVIDSSILKKDELLNEDEIYSNTNKEKLRQTYEELVDNYLSYDDSKNE